MWLGSVFYSILGLSSWGGGWSELSSCSAMLYYEIIFEPDIFSGKWCILEAKGKRVLFGVPSSSWLLFLLFVCFNCLYCGARTCLPVQETEEMWVRSLGQEDPLDEGMVAYASILAWRIPWTEEPGRL